ncbi:hypothetical protein ACFYU8_18080 [Brevibacillus sp. NPDC003359]|uniref:hypothetical protein n=1 Tax=unclassified Brevibacillus TaxID=2684853 RepID=UPI00369A29FE
MVNKATPDKIVHTKNRSNTLAIVNLVVVLIVFGFIACEEMRLFANDQCVECKRGYEINDGSNGRNVPLGVWDIPQGEWD